MVTLVLCYVMYHTLYGAVLHSICLHSSLIHTEVSYSAVFHSDVLHSAIHIVLCNLLDYCIVVSGEVQCIVA